MASASTIHSTKAAEIHRENGGRIYYVCFHCGFDSDSISDTLDHIEIHFASETSIQTTDVDFVDIKSEPFDEHSHHVAVTPSQLEQVFIDCGAKPILDKGESLQIETVSDDTATGPQTLPISGDYSSDLEGLFEWKCLQCHCLFKKLSKLEQHLKRHKSDPMEHLIDRMARNGEPKPLYAFKCTLCSSEFNDSHSSEEHLINVHTAPPPVKCFLCFETFTSAESLKRHMSSFHEGTENEATTKSVSPTQTVERAERVKLPADATKRLCVCPLCDKTFIGIFEFMQHTFGHFDLKMFTCSECSSHFQRKSSFIGHMKKVHDQRVEMKFLCRFCDDGVDHVNLYAFVKHAFTHHLDDGDRNNSNMDPTFSYQCRFCFEEFNKWNDICTHSYRHADDELPKELPAEQLANGRAFSERAKSGTNRSEFLYNCFSCTSTLRGSNEARTHWITDHKPSPKAVHYRILETKETQAKKTGFKCYDCDNSFDTELYLMRHRLAHFNLFPYLCNLCPRSFSATSNVTRHMIKEHDAKEHQHRQFVCKFCKAKFTDDSDFIAHNFNDHLYENFDIGENLDGLCKYECVYCEEITTERESMDQHLKTHADEVIPEPNGKDKGSNESSINELQHKVEFLYICHHCPLKFRLPYVAKSHATLGHKAEKSETVFDTLNHTKTSTEINRSTHCDLCNITFKTWRSMVNHSAKLHPETFIRTTKFYKKKVGQPANTRKKQRRTPEGNLCDICNSTFLNNRSMINHRAKRHPEAIQTREHRPVFNCPICGKIVRERSNFNHHMETHAKRHWYTCDICEKTYRIKHSLQTHMLTHTNEKNFICEECGKSFYTTSKLNLHKQVHENLTLKCDQCDKVFYTRNNFSKHKKTHIDNVRKTCNMCKNTFKSSASFRVHMLLHDETKKYSCRYCNMTFAQSSGRRGHERARHGFV